MTKVNVLKEICEGIENYGFKFDKYMKFFEDDAEFGLRDSLFSNPYCDLFQKIIEKFKEKPSPRNPLFDSVYELSGYRYKIPKAKDLLCELTIIALESGGFSEYDFVDLLGGYEPGAEDGPIDPIKSAQYLSGERKGYEFGEHYWDGYITDFNSEQRKRIKKILRDKHLIRFF